MAYCERTSSSSRRGLLSRARCFPQMLMFPPTLVTGLRLALVLHLPRNAVCTHESYVYYRHCMSSQVGQKCPWLSSACWPVGSRPMEACSLCRILKVMFSHVQYRGRGQAAVGRADSREGSACWSEAGCWKKQHRNCQSDSREHSEVKHRHQVEEDESKECLDGIRL